MILLVQLLWTSITSLNTGHSHRRIFPETFWGSIFLLPFLGSGNLCANMCHHPELLENTRWCITQGGPKAPGLYAHPTAG